MPNLEQKSVPSDKQTRELWEWCGQELCGLGVWIPHLKKWIPLNESIDLNNLLRYAMPQFTIKFGITKTRELLHKWINDAYMSLPEAKYLMLAIREVIKK